MGNKPRDWPADYPDWPQNNSNPAQDRDQAAESAAEIDLLVARMTDAVGSGKFTREGLLYGLARLQREASTILRLMERNGAPTRPRR